MKNESTLRKSLLAVALSCAGILAAGAAPSFAKDMALTLAGDQEVPAVTTTASGTGTITVNDDKSVSGSVMTKGIEPPVLDALSTGLRQMKENVSSRRLAQASA